MTEAELLDLKERAQRLVRVLDEWEPGLFTWCGAVNDLWWNVVQWAPEAAAQRLHADAPRLMLTNLGNSRFAVVKAQDSPPFHTILGDEIWVQVLGLKRG